MSFLKAFARNQQVFQSVSTLQAGFTILRHRLPTLDNLLSKQQQQQIHTTHSPVFCLFVWLFVCLFDCFVFCRCCFPSSSRVANYENGHRCSKERPELFFKIVGSTLKSRVRKI